MLLDPAGFRDVVSGRRSGLAAGALRAAMRVAEAPYALAMRARNAAYDRGLLRSHCADVPVISVGNLSVGGTGKTPLVEWIARWFRHRDVPVGVVSRGYRAPAGAPNDEALELAQKLPGLPHVQNPDRLAAVRDIVARHGCRVVVLDDAFQHRRIARDVDVVLLDALEPFGWDHVLPRGALREPLVGLQRADVIALSRSDAISADQREAIRARVRGLAPAADWTELRHRPLGLLTAGGVLQPLEPLAGRRVAAFCGIGNPAGFRHTLRALGCDVAAFRSFPDHHAYEPADLADIEAWVADLHGVDTLLCTQKDMVKLNLTALGRWPLWAIPIGLEISAGRDRLEQHLERVTERGG